MQFYCTFGRCNVIFSIMKYIQREIQKRMIHSTKKFPVITIIGPRQSGKSTLAQNVFPECYYYNLEDPETRSFAQSDPKGFLYHDKKSIIIDEIQRVPELLSYIQVLVDETNKPGSFIITGSQNLLISESISQTLAGRTAVFSLLPFSLSEIKKTKQASLSLEKWMHTGSYPRIYDADISPEMFYSSYINTYLERDVRNLKNIENLNRFQTFLQLCAARTGQLLNFTNLAEETGISLNTAKSWISILEASYILFLLRPHFVNFSKRLIKTPKLFFYDTGIVCSLLNIRNPKTLVTHHIRGNLFETAIMSEIVKTYHNKMQRPPIFFWRDKTGHEIDCLIDEEGKLLPIEIKSGKTIQNNFFKGIKYYQKLSSSKIGYVIYGGNTIQNRTNTTVLPWNSLKELFTNFT